jgi:hypothetical protein
MAKKSTRAKYTSKGQHSNVARGTVKAVRKEIDIIDQYLNKLKAWSKGKRTMVTVENPNPNETNKRFIKLEGNVVFGPWKRTVDVMKSSNND